MMGVLRFPGRRSRTAPAPVQPQAAEINPDTVRAVADLAAKLYADEYARPKDLDGKAAAGLVAAGTIVVFAAGSLTKTPPGCRRARRACTSGAWSPASRPWLSP